MGLGDVCGSACNFQAMSLLERFQQSLEGLGLRGKTAVVAVSGGPDSVALLDLLVRSADILEMKLTVAHFDHGIHPESSAVAEQVAHLARSSGLAIQVGHGHLGEGAGETEARSSRHAWLEAVRMQLGAQVILTAHHAEDQAETVFMRFLAGSGPAGLAGMALISGHLVRPLLQVHRGELTAYLRERGLSAWIDPANADPRHLRSWIRTEVLPQLQRRVPHLGEHITRVAAQAAQDRAAWDAVLELLPGLDLQMESGAISVAASALAGYDSALAQSLVLAAARRVGCRLGPARSGRIFDLLKHRSSGASVPLGSGWSAELSFGRLRLASEPRPLALGAWEVMGHQGRREWGRWTFRWQTVPAPERQERTGFTAWFTPDSLTVRSWTPGEKLRPLGGTGRRLVVRCMQEVRVPRGRRGAWPVVAEEAQVIWIPGVCRSDARVPVAGTEALRVDAEYA
jgi:tRNA(Ile)-lysidine synthase